MQKTRETEVHRRMCKGRQGNIGLENINSAGKTVTEKK
jgi:hypothetical protein